VLKEPVQLTIGAGGELTLPLGLLAEAGLNPGEVVIAHSDGDGRILLRRTSEAAEFLLGTGTL
jgi:bifunctional DNA-binding transcriptional regulator/antitoxin component of YhaV-PrlF toxin-antitoxin module